MKDVLRTKWVWASISIVFMWVAVLFIGLFGPDIVNHDVAGAQTTVPVSVVVGFFALVGTIIVARHGFRDDEHGPARLS